jgi:formamidopyrimidine-DNA glycosylase
MPELPEVETIVRELNASHLIGLKIEEVNVFWERSIADPKAEEFASKLIHEKVLKISRRGKFIVFTLSHYTLLLHLRMTGKLSFSNDTKLRSSHERVQLKFNNGMVLHYEDQRKFGKWYLLEHPEAKLGSLGLEPLSKEFSLPTFKDILKKSSQQIKPFLLDQSHLVGLGNIYADEALWLAKIHPMRKVDSLSPSEIEALYHSIPEVLEQGIKHMGTSLGSKQANYFSVSGRRGGNQTQLKVFRREGLLCPRCQTLLIKITVAQRGTHLCPNCQKV